MSSGGLYWPAQALQQELAAHLPGITVEVLDTVDSTNSELMRRARAGRREPVLLVAERQTAGRGRLGRTWHSDGPVADAARSDGVAGAASGALTFSLGLFLAPQDWSGLSLAVGLAVARSLHPALQLKWPNDIWLQGRKLAGILIETASFAERRYVIVGIGINIAPREGTGLSTAPAWLQELLPGLDAPAVLQRLAPALVQAVLLFEARGFAPFHAPFQQRDALAGRAVVLSDGTVGSAVGVDAAGALLVHTAAGMKHITSAEVSVRPTGSLDDPATVGPRL